MNHTQAAPRTTVPVLDSGYAPPAVSTPLFRIDDRARPTPSLARFALGPISLVIAFALFYGGYAPQLVVMCIVGLGLIAFQWASVLANASRDAYDRAAVTLMSKGEAKALRARLHAATFFRWFAPPAELAARRGAVAASLGESEEAAKQWKNAVTAYPRGVVPRSVAVGFAGAAFAAGWDRDAMRAYRALYEGDPELPKVRVRLAHALAKLGEDQEEAESLLAAAEKGAPDDEIAVARAALKNAGKKKVTRAKNG